MKDIDKLGALKAQIAELKEQEKALANKVKGQILDSGEISLEGDLFRATLSLSTRNTVNWEKIARDLGASKQKIARNTQAVPCNSLRLSARKTERRAA